MLNLHKIESSFVLPKCIWVTQFVKIREKKIERNIYIYIYKTNVEIYFHHLVLFYSKYIVQEKY